MLPLILIIAACIVFGLAAVNVPTGPRVNLVALGLCFWTLSLFVERL